MKRRLLGVAALAVLAAGCGGGGGSSASDAATLVPASTVAYITIDTNRTSGQIGNAKSILDKFPFAPTVYRGLKQELDRFSVLGPETDFAVLTVGRKTTYVALTQPKNEKALDEKLDASKPKELHRQVDGWTAFSESSAALAEVGTKGPRLAAVPTYVKAFTTVPGSGHALVRAYASSRGLGTLVRNSVTGLLSPRTGALSPGNGALAALPKTWVSLALSADNGALKLEAHAKENIAPSTTQSLAGQLPSGSILAASFVGTRRGSTTLPKAATSELQALSRRIGTNLVPFIDTLRGPVILYVRPGAPLPEVTIAAKPPKPQAALKAIKAFATRLTAGATKPVPTKVPGGTLDKLNLGALVLWVGELGTGEIVISDSQNALAELKGADGRLSGDGVFKQAQSESGLPSANSGFLFVDAVHLMPIIEGFAQQANAKIPPSVEADLRPVQSLLIYASRNGPVGSFVTFLQTS
ncbi:MAG TPA: hypothetical protein VFB25_11325 [Gaiellaceae bacterium]|nr:hypothetical protein [Gaiellaceae bacterium]